ncbi:MAG: substrate-binding domain-containing protein [Burkholderiales bacterium]
MKSVKIEPVWKLGDERFEASFFDLLQAIRDRGSLAAAARAVDLSYRHVWDLMRRCERALGQPLARLERGRGAELTAAGEALLGLQQRLGKLVAPALRKMESELVRELAVAGQKRPRQIVLHVSHDLALAQLRDSPGRDDKSRLEFHFHGSRENLLALSRGHCDFAGFHIAEQTGAPELARLLKPGTHKVIGVALRDQGLMVARGNPKRVQGLHDLTRRGVRFVNRQPGSGTRLVLDQLLDNAGIDGKRIAGYQAEEFTHLAVAATVAGGMADAGFGIRAAAAQYGLGFIPLVTERYLLACRGDRIDPAVLREVSALLRGRRFKDIIAGLPGYDDAIAGIIMDVGEALAGPRPARGGGN